MKTYPAHPRGRIRWACRRCGKVEKMRVREDVYPLCQTCRMPLVQIRVFNEVL